MRQRTPAPPKGKKKKKASWRIADGSVRERACKKIIETFCSVCVCGLAFLPPKEVTKRSSSYGILEKRRSWVVVEKLALEKLHYCLPSFAEFKPKDKEPEWAMGRTGWGGARQVHYALGSH